METSEPNEFVILIDYWITDKNDRQTSEPNEFGRLNFRKEKRYNK